MARRGKREKVEVIIFELNLESELLKLVDELKHGKYKTGKYRTFKIYEPKERVIQASENLEEQQNELTSK